MVRKAAALALGLLAALSAAAPAVAHEGQYPTSPADGSVLTVTPREILIDLTDIPTGSVSVSLVDADSGQVIPFTGADPVVDGQEVVAYPPSLEPGTYAVRYSYDSASGPRVGLFAFSVGAPSAAVVTFAETSDSSGLAWWGIALLLVAAIGFAAAVPLWFRRRSFPAPAALATLSALLATGIVLTGASPLLALSALAPALLFAVGLGARPRLGLLLGASAAGLAGGLLAGFTGPAPALSGGLLALGGLAAAVILGSGFALALAPARARVIFRRWWPAPVLSAVVLPAAWVGSFIAQGGDLTDVFSFLGLVLSVALAVLAMVAFAAASVLLLRRRPRPVAVVAVGASLLMLGSLVSLAPSAPTSSEVEVLALDPSGSADQCLNDGDRLATTACLQGLFGAKARARSVTASLDELRGAVGSSPALRFYCHETAHAIGRASLAANGGNVTAAFSDGYDVCDFGYYHGIIEGAAGALSDDEFVAAVPELCAELASANQLFFLQCTHGIGHAAARRANNDIVRGLEFCEALDNSPNYPAPVLDGALNACGTGVTMEWFAVAGANGGADGNAVTPAVDSLRDVCNAVADRWQPECLEYVGNTVDTSRPKDSLLEMAAWCRDTAYPESCFNGLARAAAGIGLSPEDSIEMCQEAGDGRSKCLLNYLITVATTIDYSVDAVDRVCSLLPQSDRSGSSSVCEQARKLATEVLSTGDGKPQPGTDAPASPE